ncbi:hypothetical protein C1366_22080 [Salmonella enterica]|nr:hypothetical protein [Salmonella enterica]
MKFLPTLATSFLLIAINCADACAFELGTFKYTNEGTKVTTQGTRAFAITCAFRPGQDTLKIGYLVYAGRQTKKNVTLPAPGVELTVDDMEITVADIKMNVGNLDHASDAALQLLFDNGYKPDGTTRWKLWQAMLALNQGWAISENLPTAEAVRSALGTTRTTYRTTGGAQGVYTTKAETNLNILPIDHIKNCGSEEWVEE